MKFHNHLKAYRIEILQMKQSDLANLLGISQSCLSNYENGRRTYPSNILRKMSELGNIPFPIFLELVFPKKYNSHLFAGSQIMMEKTAQQYLGKDFIDQYRYMFEKEKELRDFVQLISKLPLHERTNLLMKWKLKIIKLIQKG